MAHDLVSLITVVDGFLHSNDQEDWILEDHKKLPLNTALKKPVTTVINRIFHCTTDQEDRVLDDQLLLQSLLEKATSLRNLLEKSRHHVRGNKEIVEAEIHDVAHEAEDIIESHAMIQRLSKPHLHRSLRNAIQKFDAAEEKLMKIIKDDQSREEDDTTDVIKTTFSVAAEPTSSKRDIAMVGFDEDALHLKGRLTSQRHCREIIPIVGMGGIGKSTMARNLYNDPLIVSHFDARAWVTVTQDYKLRTILLDLLGCTCKFSDDMLKQNESDLGLNLYQRLCGRRYLVVLDDIWSEKVWDEIKHYLPNEKQRSRILITSRELHVAKHPDSACEEHQMHLLSNEQGWDLLRQKVFDAKKQERCPPFLEEIGRIIVSECGGLPLAISVIGGLLSQNKYSKDVWEQVAEDVSSVLSYRDEQFSKILWLSYDNLPLHLKPCFLYMAAFPEDFVIRGSKLVKLWVAEGFLWRSNGNNKCLEDVGDEYLKALVDRNLLSVAYSYDIGRSKSYGMHDLLRDHCVRKAKEENFLRIVKNEKVNDCRRVSIHPFTEDAHDFAEHLSLSRSLLCSGPVYGKISISQILSSLRLVRVLNVCNITFRKFPEKILKLVNLRFLAVTFFGILPSRIWRLRNLQTLITGYHLSDLTLPSEAWKISGLRHIILKDLAISIDFKILQVHENLQTIFGVFLRDLFASNLINSIPNVRKLRIHDGGFDSEDTIIDLSHLHKLETLKFRGIGVAVLSALQLPNCLKKVSLSGCTIPMRLFNVIGGFKNVEVLKIYRCEFQSEEHNVKEEEEEEEWELSEGVEFYSLQFLELNCLKLVRWKVDCSHFPRLKQLKIRWCNFFEEIPTSIGEISTLEMIELDHWNPSLVAWAEEIQDTQRREYGNESLKINLAS